MTEERKSYFVEEPQFETWLGKRLIDGIYDGNEGKLTEWYNGVHWNTRIRISGGPLVTDDLLAEGVSKDRAEARKEAEDQAQEKLGRLTANSRSFGLSVPDPEVAALQALLVQAHGVLLKVGDDDHLQTDETLEAAAEVWSSIERHEPKIPGLTS